MQLFPYFSKTTKRRIADHWRLDRFKSSKSRWLNAIEKYGALFEPNMVFQYWSISGDEHAARLLVEMADPTFIETIISDLIGRCGNGAILARAATKVRKLEPKLLLRIKRRFPATFLYVCARREIVVGSRTAFLLFQNAEKSGELGLRSLMVWSIGQMGMSTTLEKIIRIWPKLMKEDEAAVLAEYNY